MPLTFDTEFFDVLHNDVQQLDTIQDTEKASLAKKIKALSNDVAEMSKPHKFSKSDMYQWLVTFFFYTSHSRPSHGKKTHGHSKMNVCNSNTHYYRRELFELYLDASPFFSTREADGGPRHSGAAAKQLTWFQNEIKKRGIDTSFKMSASRKALDKFININVILLQNLSFQEINQKAVRKILKSTTPLRFQESIEY